MQRNTLPASAVRCTRRRSQATVLLLDSSTTRRFSRRALVAAVALASTLSSLPDSVGAQTAGLQERAFGLQEALAKTLEHNKELAAFEYRLDEQAGRLEQAGLVPNPELHLALEDVAGSGRYKGFDSAQTTLSLDRFGC